MSERRKFPRWGSKETARAVFKYRHAIDCKIVNLSTGGACLESPYVTYIPDTFDLIRAVDDDDVVCRVVWRGEGRIGVSFR
jgi:hypothetical protein